MFSLAAAESTRHLANPPASRLTRDLEAHHGLARPPHSCPVEVGVPHHPHVGGGGTRWSPFCEPEGGGGESHVTAFQGPALGGPG